MLDTFDKLASIFTFITVVAAAAFYSGALWPCRIMQARANVVTVEGASALLLVAARVLNRTRFDQRIQGASIVRRPQFAWTPRGWWRRVTWRRSAHRLRDPLPIGEKFRRYGYRDAEQSPSVGPRGGQTVWMLCRKPPAAGSEWDKQAIDSQRLYVCVNFDGGPSTCRRLKFSDAALPNPFNEQPAAARTEDDLAARLALTQAIATAADAVAAASAATEATVDAMTAALEALRRGRP